MSSQDSLAAVESALRESEAYERFRLARRRGVVNLAWGLLTSSIVVVEAEYVYFGGQTADHNTLFIRGLLDVAFWAMMLVSSVVFIVAGVKWHHWKGLFYKEPRAWHDLRLRREDLKQTWPALAVVLIMMAVTIFTGPDWQAGIFVLVMPAVLLSSIQWMQGARSGDWVLARLAIVTGVLALAPLLANRLALDIPAALWSFMIVSFPIVWLGAFRLLAPRRWLAR